MRTGAGNHRDRKWIEKTHWEQRLQNKTGNRTQGVGKHATPKQHKNKRIYKKHAVIIQQKPPTLTFVFSHKDSPDYLRRFSRSSVEVWQQLQSQWIHQTYYVECSLHCLADETAVSFRISIASLESFDYLLPQAHDTVCVCVSFPLPLSPYCLPSLLSFDSTSYSVLDNWPSWDVSLSLLTVGASLSLPLCLFPSPTHVNVFTSCMVLQSCPSPGRHDGGGSCSSGPFSLFPDDILEDIQSTLSLRLSAMLQLQVSFKIYSYFKTVPILP